MILRFLVLVACIGCVAPPLQQGDTSAAVGCYSVTVGEWSQPGIAWRIPQTISLDSTVAHEQSAAVQTWFVLGPDAPTLSRARGGGESVWQPISADSVRLVWSGDYEQLNARLELRDGRMQGIVRGSTDVIRPTELLPWASVSAGRVPCPTEI
jgi:hypothetical protein